MVLYFDIDAGLKISLKTFYFRVSRTYTCEVFLGGNMPDYFRIFIIWSRECNLNVYVLNKKILQRLVSYTHDMMELQVPHMIWSL
jgi:hypothetical protein